MKIFIIIILAVFFTGSYVFSQHETKKWVVVIHGGAGAISKKYITPEMEKAYYTDLNRALDTAAGILENGGTALNAVEAAIIFLENSPLFNAGKGAVFTHAGKNELDAAIMDGKNLKAGAVAGVGDVKNPIRAARSVMEKSEHVFLSGKGASDFARIVGLEMVDSSYFYTEARWQNLQNALSKEKHGTVGCVVLDQYGNLAAGTSTGGMNNKKYGRIGDAPIIGAGTYANNVTCAVSATGHGEFFIRYTVAHDISALMEYKKYSVAKAADKVIMDKLVKAGGNGGVIAVDRKGNIAMPFNTEGMFRGYRKWNGEKFTGIYKE